MQRPARSVPPSNIVSHGDLLAAASSPVICAGGCIENRVFGQTNSIVLKHPSLDRVYLKLPTDIISQTDVPVTSVPLVMGPNLTTELIINGQWILPIHEARDSAIDKSTLSLVYTRVNQAVMIVSALIKVVQGPMYTYDVISSTWQYFWGP